jgi:hypothetical protein
MAALANDAERWAKVVTVSNLYPGAAKAVVSDAASART